MVIDGTWVTMIQPARNISLIHLQVFANLVYGNLFVGQERDNLFAYYLFEMVFGGRTVTN